MATRDFLAGCKILLAAVLLLGCSEKPEAPKPQAPAASAPVASEAPKPAAALSEKDKALANPYPNDLGPDKLPEAVLAAYPASIKEGYQVLLQRCSQCHSSARPLNSRFVELEGKDAAVAKLKKSQPEVFDAPAIWQIEGSVWNRYVKRMMSKPGCEISPAEGKKIWEFLVHDGERRKLGVAAAAWKTHRLKLVEEFKTKHPARYKELAAANDL